MRSYISIDIETVESNPIEFIESYDPLKTIEANLAAAKYVQIFGSGTVITDVNNNIV